MRLITNFRGEKKLYKTKNILVKPKKGYVRPEIDFSTTTTIWPVDEYIKRRLRDWRRLLGEDGHTGARATSFRKEHFTVYTGTYSVFPIPLMEWILVRYAGPPGGKVLDAFAGGPPRMVASSIMGYEYHGFEVRQQQIDENWGMSDELELDNMYYYLCDAREMDSVIDIQFDIAVTCPPYFNLETYSDQEDDLSTFKNYWDFDDAMYDVAQAHFPLMKQDAFICIVIGNFRDKKTGELIDFRSHTVNNFKQAGFKFWQEIILSKNIGSAAKRSTNAWKGMKLVPRHEFLLVFRKV